MTKREWKLEKEWKDKRQGQVWIVRDNRGCRGFFKFAREDQYYYAGTMIANEMITTALARKLGFPAARLEEAEIRGSDGTLQQGIVSIAADTKDILTWDQADDKLRKNPQKYIRHTDLLRTLVVFDAWTCNIDRASGKNLVLYRKRGRSKYKWYLIDHGLALYGSPHKWSVHAWDSDYWDDLWNYHHVPKRMLKLSSSYSALRPMIHKIRALRESDLEEAVDRVPQGYLNENQRRWVKELLLRRQEQLKPMIKRWLNYSGIKEYQG